jgi:hypothetical protein
MIQVNRRYVSKYICARHAKCVHICQTEKSILCVVLLGLLRHQTDVGRRAHRLDVELTVLLDVLAPAQGGGKEKMKKRRSKIN